MNSALRSRLQVVAITLLTCIADCAVGDDAAWEWSPYRVQLNWDVASLSTEDLNDAVSQRLAERFGAAWRAADDALDKRFDVRIAYERGAYVVEVREWDAIVGELGFPVIRRSAQRDAVEDLVVAAVIEAFRPILLVDEARTTSAHVRQRAAALFPPELLDSLTRRGAAYVPYMRRFDRDGFAVETKAIPWTLLVIDEPRGGEAVCVVRTGLHNPFSIRRRGRTERLAVAVGHPTGSTVLKVTANDGRPLVGCRVYSQDADAPAVPLGETDSRGSIVVAADDGRVRMIVVTSQFVPLAKLPIVPGAAAEIVAPTVGTPQLFAAEERLTAWQTEFLDLFVERRVHLSLAARHIEAGDRTAGEAALKRLERIDSLNRRLTQLETLERRYVVDAKSHDRAVAELFDDARTAAIALDDSGDVIELYRRLNKLSP